MTRRQCEAHRRQVNELRCIEMKWQRQVDTIGEAVAALSGQVPVGCELHLNDSVSTPLAVDEEPVHNYYLLNIYFRIACGALIVYFFLLFVFLGFFFLNSLYFLAASCYVVIVRCA